LSLLVPILALAAGTATQGTVVAPGVSLQVVSELPVDGKAGPPGPRPAPGPSRPARFTIGAVDTVGGTTYDWGANGPALRMVAQTPDKGIHVLWMYSTDMSNTTFPDRNMRYNFYDYNTHAWNWTDPDFMQAGVSVFAERSGYGRIDTDTNGVAVISAHDTTGTGTADFAPVIARDADVGVGIFEYSYGENSAINHYEWPWVAVGMNGTYHLAMIDANNQDNLYYSRCTAWPTWSAAVAIPPPEPDPLFPTHNIATSKVPGSNKVCITWVATPASGYMQQPAYYRESQDGGENWDATVDLGYPPAYGPDTVPSFHLSSLFPLYDRQDRLHIVGNVGPYVRDTNWILPGQIWHWCASNPNTWDLIHIAAPESLNASVGYNVMICARPSLGEDANGNLFVAWEEFDGVNVEQTTSRVRADIWYSSSTDNGVTWGTAVRITDGGDVTYRFPSILNPIADTVMVEYLIDQVAGFFLYNEGPATSNPIVVQKWKNPYIGIQGPKVAQPSRMEITVRPSPARGRTAVSYALPRAGDISLVVYDAAGRPVRTLASGHRAAGRYTATWNARDAVAGIYFCTLESGGNSITRKIVLSE
jgi:hypothetical protein